MIAIYGYEDASGRYFISIDTAKCSGCGDCVRACSCGVLTLMVDDYGQTVPEVDVSQRKKLRYTCAPCKPVKGRGALQCVAACNAGAITHSW